MHLSAVLVRAGSDIVPTEPTMPEAGDPAGGEWLAVIDPIAVLREAIHDLAAAAALPWYLSNLFLGRILVTVEAHVRNGGADLGPWEGRNGSTLLTGMVRLNSDYTMQAKEAWDALLTANRGSPKAAATEFKSSENSVTKLISGKAVKMTTALRVVEGLKLEGDDLLVPANEQSKKDVVAAKLANAAGGVLDWLPQVSTFPEFVEYFEKHPKFAKLVEQTVQDQKELRLAEIRNERFRITEQSETTKAVAFMKEYREADPKQFAKEAGPLLRGLFRAKLVGEDES